MSRVIHLNEITPNHIYQRGQFLTFPVLTKMNMLHQYQIDMVVNLWSRPDPELHQKPGLIYIHWPISGAEEPDLLLPMLSLFQNMLKADRKILVHCEAGVNRSIYIACLMKAMFENIPTKIALEEISSKIHTKIRSGLQNSLLSFDN